MLRRFLARLTFFRFLRSVFDDDPASDSRKGTHQLIERYVRSGAFDLGDPWLTCPEFESQRFLGQVPGFALPPNRQGKFNPYIKHLTFRAIHFQEVTRVTQFPARRFQFLAF